MSQLPAYPMVDAFKTLLAQQWDGQTGRVYLNAVPNFTFPSGVGTYICVNMSNNLKQVALITEIDTTLVRVNVTSIAVNSGEGVAYTSNNHPVNSEVIISDNYQFWKDIDTTLRSKVNTNDSTMIYGYFSTLAARNAAFPSPVSGKYSAFTAEEGVRRDYDSSGRSTRQGGTTVNASESLAGKGQIATLAAVLAGTRTGGTGAINVVSPDYLASVLQGGTYRYAGASVVGTDSYAVSPTPAITALTTGMRVSFKTDVANTGACTMALSGLTAKSMKMPGGTDPLTGSIPAASIIEVEYDGTNWIVMGGSVDVSVRSTIVPIQRTRNAAGTTVTYNHNLGRIPKTASFEANLREDTTYWSKGVYDNVSGTPALNTFYKTGASTGSLTQTYAVEVSYSAGAGQRGVFQNLTATTFDIVRSLAGSSAGSIDLFVTLT